MSGLNRVQPESHTSVVGPALIASLGIYCPVPLLRGALFGMFPGIANRSRRLVIRGALLGALLEFLFFAVWGIVISYMFLGMAWETRAGYNPFLCTVIPGSFVVHTHLAHPWSNSVQFQVNIMVWVSYMVFGWWIMWRPRLSVPRLVMMLVTANLAAWASGALLLAVSPMHFSSFSENWRITAPIELSDSLWVVVYLAVFPVSGVVIAQWFRGRTRTHGQARTHTD